jgi:hypothetical protein
MEITTGDTATAVCGDQRILLLPSLCGSVESSKKRKKKKVKNQNQMTFFFIRNTSYASMMIDKMKNLQIINYLLFHLFGSIIYHQFLVAIMVNGTLQL